MKEIIKMKLDKDNHEGEDDYWDKDDYQDKDR